MKPTAEKKRAPGPAVSTGVCVLTGGLSSRMGRDKSRLRLGEHSLLSRIRETAAAVGLPLRIVRRDLVARCGPLGGVYTGLKTSRSEAELFLACDMPFVSAALITKLLKRAGQTGKAVFATTDGRAGFPFLLGVGDLPVVEKQIRSKDFSLQALAQALGARLVGVPPRDQHELFNINTPIDWQTALRIQNRGQR
jgi:molybdopterin-guanine dinucleotide biosynthesis protein A